MRHLLLILCALFTLSSCAQISNKEQTKEENTEKAVIRATELTTDEFCQKVVDIRNFKGWEFLGDKPAVIDFHAPWCGPCRQMGPIIDKLANEYAGKVDFYKVNVDNEEELALFFEVSSIPTLLFIPTTGKPQGAKGLLPEASLRQAIDTFLLK